MQTLKMFRLDKQVAIVTGGAGLYGKHISLALCEGGAKVVIASRNAAKCKEQANNLRKQGYEAIGLKLDLSNKQDIRDFTKRIIQMYGQIDILVNNSVSRYGLNDLEETTVEGWENAQKVNGTGLMSICQHVVQHMKQQKKGNIINISSIQGVQGPHFPVYGNTGMTSGIEYTYAKWGMVGITKWMSNYYGKDNIRVNCISPGGYNEVGSKDEIKAEEFVENYRKMTPLGRFAEADDIKGAIVFMASEASRYMTGHNLIIDGGWSNW
ncbi:NAD(P)-dependent dehydrogenase, short-chain alcohol dehydrogenase family [Virgibacillus subterraneus]|uniref:NAD(P)-dependent dehydrogenase, short-chain alcohol dehydrogenase family n=1 Tax=Virgibacillus subterraneus TaxID=621109 RepID=A0A1H9G5D4_9BACI|nr:SDR family oxidoreductase [Virgibacillus subterraneus]SEQ45356.1 NAD(P)-dependent dehydrogenase, short-chain alcohol dehydrogenase family [Virgibacillus subterraneus]